MCGNAELGGPFFFRTSGLEASAGAQVLLLLLRALPMPVLRRTFFEENWMGRTGIWSLGVGQRQDYWAPAESWHTGH